MRVLAPTRPVCDPATLLALALAAAALAVPAPAALAASPNLVISQVYGGGGNSGSTWKNDFIEVMNTGVTSVNLTGWTVQYAAATGTSWSATALSGTLLPGQYFLVQEAAGGGGTTALPTPDATGSISMSATAGKVALVSNSTLLPGACPGGLGIVDFIGYGTTANCYEGDSPAPAPNAVTADLRGSNGCLDQDNNLFDFAVGTPVPRNSASPRNECHVVPVDGASWGKIKSFYR
jgi:hypothetical protein